MIVDNFKSSKVYKGFADYIYAGLRLLQQTKTGIKISEYFINNNVKVIVSEYMTIKVSI